MNPNLKKLRQDSLKRPNSARHIEDSMPKTTRNRTKPLKLSINVDDQPNSKLIDTISPTSNIRLRGVLSTRNLRASNNDLVHR